MKLIAPVLLGVALAACTLVVDTGGLSGGAPADPVADGGTAGTGDAATKQDGDTVVACTIPTASDPKNCGACGRDCLGGECTDGECGPSTIADGFANPLGVGATSTKVYVGHDRGLVELDLDGKNPRLVVPELAVHYLHATETDVFFTESTTNALRRWPRSGGEAVVLTNANNLLGVAISPTHLFFTRYTDPGSGGGVYRVTYPNVGPQEKLFAYDRSETIDWLGGTLFVGSDGTNNVITVKDDGIGERTVILQGGGPVGVGVFGAYAFIARQGGGQVVRVPTTGGKADILARNRDRPSGIVATAKAVYWVDYGSGELVVLVR